MNNERKIVLRDTRLLVLISLMGCAGEPDPLGGVSTGDSESSSTESTESGGSEAGEGSAEGDGDPGDGDGDPGDGDGDPGDGDGDPGDGACEGLVPWSAYELGELVFDYSGPSGDGSPLRLCELAGKPIVMLANNPNLFLSEDLAAGYSTGTGQTWADFGILLRNLADEGKIVVVDVLMDFGDLEVEAEDAVAWAMDYPGGDHIHVIADVDAAMQNAVAPPLIGYPGLLMIEPDFTWGTSDQTEIEAYLAGL